MKRKTISTLAITLALAIAAPAAAQDMNTLGRHLENQQWQRLQDHQNRNRTMKPSRNSRENRPSQSRQRAALPACSIDLVSSRDRRRMEAEYNRIVRASGSRKADAWAQQQGRIHARQMRQKGLCR
ncbi:hypothetical protein [Mesorhizobium sp. CAU 1732]|uniref:hypothetical protein n=1 Tax=Mesorhizobium sp. CAU 1732 TaxID=3140358 RepID=UPI00326042AB